MCIMTGKENTAVVYDRIPGVVIALLRQTPTVIMGQLVFGSAPRRLHSWSVKCQQNIFFPLS